MVLKQIRLSRHLSQDQLAQMSGLSVRTIQRIESGLNASLESQKCLAAALDIDIETLLQERLVIDRTSDNWKQLPLFLKVWFAFNLLQLKPQRNTTRRVQIMAHSFGFIFACFGLVNEAALVGGLMMLATGYLFNLLLWQGDYHGIWFDVD